MPIAIECTCGKRFNVKDEWAGQTLECQICGGSIFVPAAEAEIAPAEPVEHSPQQPPPPLPQAMAIPEDSKMCEYCAEPIPQDAMTCPLCGESLQHTVPPERQREILSRTAAELDQYTGDFSNLESDNKLAGAPIRAMTIVLSIISLISTAMIVGGAMMHKDDGVLLVVFGVILLFIFGLSALVAIFNDFKAKIKENESALQAFKSFVLAIRTKRSAKAFVRLTPAARQQAKTTIPQVEKINISEEQISIYNPEDLKKYWTGLIKPSNMQNRTCQLSKFRVIDGGKPEDKYAIVEVDMKITTYPSLLIFLILINLLVVLLAVLIVQKSETLKFRKVMIKSNGRWYFTSGDFCGPLDSLPSLENLEV